MPAWMSWSTRHRQRPRARALPAAVAAAVVLASTSTSLAQTGDRREAVDLARPGAFAVFDADGRRRDLDDVVAGARNVEVVLVGEQHDDRVGHALQLELFKRLRDRDPGLAGRDAVPLTLSLEMFERDVQYVVDEYLDDLISEEHFLSSTRPWANFRQDYRPLLELARAHEHCVIAANAPRRYVNLVARRGPDALHALSAEARRHLPPLPLAPPSDAYRAEFEAIAHGHGQGSDQPPAEFGILAQNLWDATMAYSIAEELLQRPGSRVLHLVGSFHVRNRTGLPEHLAYYRPGTSTLIVILEAVADVNDFPDELAGAGDFIILTDETQWRPQTPMRN